MCPSTSLLTTNPKWTVLSLNPILVDGKPASFMSCLPSFYIYLRQCFRDRLPWSNDSAWCILKSHQSRTALSLSLSPFDMKKRGPFFETFLCRQTPFQPTAMKGHQNPLNLYAYSTGCKSDSLTS